jgi:hypothetical protein
VKEGHDPTTNVMAMALAHVLLFRYLAAKPFRITSCNLSENEGFIFFLSLLKSILPKNRGVGA